ncbi:hypothetical protein JCM17960_12650 [Magnetospira thiophila]
MTTVYFATNRNPNRKNNPTDFGSHFGPDGLANLRFGRATVEGEEVTLEVAPENMNRQVFGSLQIFNALKNKMAEKQRDTIVFIHGFNTSFHEALRDGAQIRKNMGEENVNVLVFSWPSDGLSIPLQSYHSDRIDAKASAQSFARGFHKARDFLGSLIETDYCNHHLHLIAHSMGNYVLRHAVQMIPQVGDAATRIFDQVLLMAADEDDDAFEHEFKLRSLPRLARRVTVYFNNHDRAMWISDKTKDNPERLGHDGPRLPHQVPVKVQLVDCSESVSSGHFPQLAERIKQHSYYQYHPDVISDMRQVLDGTRAQQIKGRTFEPESNRFVLQPAD